VREMVVEWDGLCMKVVNFGNKVNRIIRSKVMDELMICNKEVVG